MIFHFNHSFSNNYISLRIIVIILILGLVDGACDIYNRGLDTSRNPEFINLKCTACLINGCRFKLKDMKCVEPNGKAIRLLPGISPKTLCYTSLMNHPKFRKFRGEISHRIAQELGIEAFELDLDNLDFDIICKKYFKLKTEIFQDYPKEIIDDLSRLNKEKDFLDKLKEAANAPTTAIDGIFHIVRKAGEVIVNEKFNYQRDLIENRIMIWQKIDREYRDGLINGFKLDLSELTGQSGAPIIRCTAAGPIIESQDYRMDEYYDPMVLQDIKRNHDSESSEGSGVKKRLSSSSGLIMNK